MRFWGWLFIFCFCWSAASAQHADIFFHETLMPSDTRYPGMRVDSEDARGVVDLTDTIYEDHYGPREGYRLVGNVMHAGRFWIGYVPIDGSERTDFIREWFPFMGPVKLAHIMFLVYQRVPAILIAEIPSLEQLQREEIPERIEDSIMLPELIVSVEARWAEHDDAKLQRYDPFRGISLGRLRRSAYVNSIQLRSLPGKATQSIGERQHHLQTLPLNIDPAQSSRLLMTAIDFSVERGMAVRYNLLWSNCACLAQHMLERAVPYKNSLDWALDKLFPLSEMLPPIFRFGLWRRGMLRSWQPGIPVELSEAMHRWIDEDGNFMERQIPGDHRNFGLAACNRRLELASPGFSLPSFYRSSLRRTP